MNDPVEISRYDKEYLTLEVAGIVHLLGKFKVIETHAVIRLWLEGGNHLNIDLGKFLNTLFFL